MTYGRKGFTIIEVSLFLAITGLLFLGVTVGVQNSIYQQRVNDSVQSFAEFLRNIYAETLNVQGLGPGRANYAIYGKLVTFGESYNLQGEETDENLIYAYNVVGKVKDKELSGGGALDLFANKLDTSVALKENDTLRVVGIVENYQLKWSAALNPPCNGNDCSYDNYKGSLLIVRHPTSGVVYTYIMNGTAIEVNRAIRDNVDPAGILRPYLNEDYFKMERVDFCVNPEGNRSSNNRRDVAIMAKARNSSAIEVIPDYDSKCIPNLEN